MSKLKLTDIVAGYGDSTVLRSVSLTVPPGAVVALLGPNGAGKSTLLKVASGLLQPRSGRVAVGELDFTGQPAHRLSRAGVCLIPEGRSLFGTMTVRENLLLTAGQDGTAAIERAIEAFPILGSRLGQQAGTLSGGEQQMLALVRSYMTHPKFVLLDEASLGLAPKIVDEIFQFIDRLRSEGAALLLVEQYVDRALAIADFAYLLVRGEIAFAGEPGELDSSDVLSAYVGVA